MKAEFVKSVTYTDLERAYSAYNTLMSVYENTCNGPYGARQHKEYFAICDSRDNIRREVINRSRANDHGEQQQ